MRQTRLEGRQLDDRLAPVPPDHLPRLLQPLLVVRHRD